MSGDLFLISARTVGLAALATALMLPPGIALAWLLARRRFPGPVSYTHLTLPTKA